jgi:phosphatidylserine/phosphatidylglycerophosphate/cardiolipin synthase-like enzyme
MMRKSLFVGLLTISLALVGRAASAADTLCDTSFEDCRTPLLNLIRNETVGIDVAFWFMEDARYSNEIVKRWQAGVPVRVIVDQRANSTYPLNAQILQQLKDAGIPMRQKNSGGILHWKMMLFAGQGKVEFSAANYSGEAFVPQTPYVNYIDEVIYFTDQTSVVNSFKTKYDDAWTSGSPFANYANIPADAALTRTYPTYALDPELNWPPAQNFRTRAVAADNNERGTGAQIDAIMYRITDRAHSDALIAAKNAEVRVRLITEPKQYRDPSRLWHAWNVDRMYMAGIEIKHRAHDGLLHQKSAVFYVQGLTFFGSSNWTSPSANSQHEHNYFTKKSNFLTYFKNQFNRKWNNSTGNLETEDFVPLPPDKPINNSPANGTTGLGTSVTLKWYGGPWAHNYDILIGTSPTSLSIIAGDQPLGPSENSKDYQTFGVANLASGTTYYWQIVGKTMANRTAAGPIWSFTTGGTATPPPPNGTLGSGDILVYAGHPTNVAGNWQVVSDGTAADGVRIWNPNKGAAKISTAQSNPPDYFEVTFDASAGVGYHLWMRGRAENNTYSNDSVFVQFSGSVTSGGSATYRIGTTSAAEYNLENCSGCGLAGWGWQDNAYGNGVPAPLIYFATSGQQTLRVQVREDGLSIDQIMLSPQKFLNTAPGTLKNDTTIYPSTDGTGTPPPPPPPSSSGEVVLYASKGAPSGNWRVEADSTAAGGSVMHNPNLGAAKITTPLASPKDYFELTFTADAGVPYHFWMRARAENNSYSNDSIYVQFSDSVDQNGSAVYRIGTTSAADPNLEDCSGCGLSGWGWQDNGWGVGVMGPNIYFAASGTHTIRVQVREDGIFLDQLMLSPSRFLTSSPGALKNDTNIYAESSGTVASNTKPDVVLYASRAIATGDWIVESSSSAAGGAQIHNPDAGAAKITTALASPTDYLELKFQADADLAYHLWLRGRAEDDYWGNDSVHVQFSDSTDAQGTPLYRIGTTSAAAVNIEDCSGCGLSGWGWQDNGWGQNVSGPLVYFANGGTHTVRVQVREDGMTLDQILLSPARFVTTSPGALKNDTRIYPEAGGVS